MKRLLILGAPIFQIPVVETAKKMGLYVGIVDINREAPAFQYADATYVCSIRDKDAVLAIARDFKPDGIVCGACDTSVLTAAFVCKSLNLPGNDEITAINSTDKVEMLKAFEKNSVAHPEFMIIRKNEANIDYSNIKYPVIVKPTDSAGGRGINLVENKDEFIDKVKDSSSAGISGDVLVEEYLDGSEVSVEVLVVDGNPYILQITDKITSGAPYFYEVGHVQPSELPQDTKNKISDLARNAVIAVGIKSGAAHVEIKITGQGPKMIELGARMGGDCITTHLINNSIEGINMTEAVIKLALGEKVDITNYGNSGKSVAIKFMPASSGKIKSIDGVDNAKKVEGVIHVEIIAKIGQEYSSAKDDTARFAYIVACGNSKKNSLEICDKAISNIKIEKE